MYLADLTTPNIEEVLEADHELLSNLPDPDTIDSVDHVLRYEAWVRAYLESFSTEYGIEICGNLDKEYNCERGDYRGLYEGREVVIEVEKKVETFSRHDHRTSGEQGWGDVGSIDIVFAASGSRSAAGEISVPVIIANEDTPDGTPTFNEWYGKAKARDNVFNKVPKEYIHLLAMYAMRLLTAEFPTKDHLHEKMGNVTVEERNSAVEQANENYRFAEREIHQHVLQFLPSADDRDEIIDLIQKHGSYWELAVRLCNTVVDHAVDKNISCSKCECGSDIFEICQGTRTHTLLEMNQNSTTEGQLAMQQIGGMNNSLAGGVLKDVVVVGYCVDCDETRVFTETTCG